MQKKRTKSFMYKRITKRLNLESKNMNILHYKFSLQAGLQRIIRMLALRTFQSLQRPGKNIGV